MMDAPSFAIVVPVTPGGRIALVRNRHPVPDLHLLEWPGGLIEPGESPRTALRRELTEETGYRAGQLSALGRYYPNSHWGTYRGHVFVAEDLRSGPPSPDPEEWLELQTLPIQKAYGRSRGGDFLDGHTIVALCSAEAFLRARGWKIGAATPPSLDTPPDRRGELA
jgi:ADP-ribose pyrophosphatase